MRTISSFSLIVLVLTFAAFAEKPTEATEAAINNYLTALSDPSYAVQLDALKKLNDLKTLYPDFSMKEFDHFLGSSIMKKSTQSWINYLTSENAGLRHSTLHVLALCKSDFPQLDMSVFNRAIDKMIEKDPILHLQADAKIASIYISSPEFATAIKLNKGLTPGDVFTYIHTQMDVMFEEENYDDANAEQGIAKK